MTLTELQEARRDALAAYVADPSPERRALAQAAVDAEKAEHARLRDSERGATMAPCKAERGST
jgi:hypothetical protein